MKNVTTLLLSLFVGIISGIMLTRSCSKQKEIVTEIVKTDTLTIARVDTITIEKPVPYKVIIRDTIYIRDTVGVTLVQEIKEYKDSTYYAKISGINAFLEEIKVYPKTVTKYITVAKETHQKPKKWGLGVSAGIAVTHDKFQPYVGLGITYDLIQW